MGAENALQLASTRFSVVESRSDHLTKKGQRTRADLIRHARESLGELGYHATTVTEITRRADVAIGTFYRYFENKEEVFILILQEVVNELYTAATGSWKEGDPFGSLRNSTFGYLSAYRENRRLIAALRDVAGSVPEAADLWWELRYRTYLLMERHVYRDEFDGLNPTLVVSALGGMVEQFAYYWFVEGQRNGHDLPSLDSAADTLSRLWYAAEVCLKNQEA